MTVEACIQGQMTQHHTQDMQFAKHTNGNWKEIDHAGPFSIPSLPTSPNMPATPVSPAMSRPSSSSTLTHLSPYTEEEHHHSHYPAMPRSVLANTRSPLEELQLRIEKQEREIAALKLCIAATHQKWQEQVQRADKAVQAQQQAENEIEELSTQLFEQANEMVAKERRERYTADEQVKLTTQELEQTRRLLRREQLLRPRMIASFDPTNVPTMDTHDLTLFRDFVQRVRSVSLDHVHRLPFMKQRLEQDILPCVQRMKKLPTQKLLKSLSQRPCSIKYKAANTMPHNTASCFACGAPRKRDEQGFQFRINDDGQCWHWIDQPCKNRLVALSNFYEFVQHLHIGLQGQHRSIESLFHEMVWLRLYLFWTRSGITINDDISAESVAFAIFKMFDARSRLF